MQVHPQAPVYQTKRIFIQASPEKVWSVLTHIPGWVNWNPKITQAQISETPRAGGRFTWKINGASIKSTLHTVQPHKAFGWSGVTFGGSAIHNWYLEAKDGSTWVSVEESMEGWLIVLFKGKMNEDLKKDMQLWLELLKGEAEQGTRNSLQGTGNRGE